MLISRRMAYIGAVLVIGLTACGSPSESTSTASIAPASPPVIQIDGSAVAGGGRPAAAPAAEDASADSTKMMAAPITYVYDGDLVDLTAPAASWYFDPASTPSTDQISALAVALGVDGEVRQLADDMGGGWMVGPDDYTTPTVNVGNDAMQSWWYNPGNIARSAPECELYPPGDPAGDFPSVTSAGAGETGVAPDAAPLPADQAPTPVCAEPTPPANVPDQAAAEAKARELFQSLGLDAASYQYETYADEWGANVTAYLTLDGIRTSMTVSVGFGAEGAITWASGYLGTPLRGADYPRIGIESAVQRLNDQSSSWMGLDTAVGRGGVESADASSSATAPAAVGGATDAVAPNTGAVEPLPAPPETAVIDPIEGVCLDDTATDCAPTGPITVDPITVTLTNARPSLEQLWASDDTVWLLPGYAFDAKDGGIYSVLAVEDKYIEVTEPTEVAVPETALPVEVDPAVDPDAPTTIDVREASVALVGLASDEAAKVAEGNGWTMRVVRIDGEDQAVTADYAEGRFNVAVVDGVVTEVVSQG